jgi:hypothetical protein
MQNIQDKINCKKLRRPPDSIEENTVCKESTGTGNRKRRTDDESRSYDYDLSELDGIFSDIADDIGYTNKSNTDRRNTEHIRNRVNISNDHIADAPTSGKSSFGSDSTESESSNSSSDSSDDDTTRQNSNARYDFLGLIRFIQGSVLDDAANTRSGTDGNEDENDTLPLSMRGVAEEFGLLDDEKQVAAYEVICASFVLNLLNETVVNNAVQAAASAMGVECRSRLDDVTASLKKMGGEEQLIMFLTGAGGCGKSHVISAARKFCHRFSQQAGIIFDPTTFYLTAYVGSAAALWGGVTIHSAAHLNRTKLTDEHCRQWNEVRILVIDEVSYLSMKDLENLDKKMRRLKKQPGLLYGGVSIVFAGDLHQLEPVGGADPVYYTYNIHWHDAINAAVILESNHRFKDDPEYGEILKRIRSNTHTEADIQAINTRFVKDKTDLPPVGEEVCYACSFNKERNSVSQAIFQQLIDKNPNVESDEAPSDEVIVIEAVLSQRKKKCSKTFHEAVFERCGDAQVATTNSKKVDPALKWYPGIPLMITSNENIKKRRGNGTLCRGLRLDLKEGVEPGWKNYDGKKVIAVSGDDCEHMLCEHWEAEKEGEMPARFKLKLEDDSVIINMPIQGETVSIGGVKISQFGVNSNIATTGHKLQGMSKDNVVVTSWNNRCKNWIYVVLSRVRTLKGLHLLKKLPTSQDFSVDSRLLREEERIAGIEERLMARRRGN